MIKGFFLLYNLIKKLNRICNLVRLKLNIAFAQFALLYSYLKRIQLFLYNYYRFIIIIIH